MLKIGEGDCVRLGISQVIKMRKDQQLNEKQ